ncbi:hypothetical protein [Arthrobacter crystallopoietes]|uniref:Uncharacterized protein n=1 Tax=Crystallibacter crystallopoietes TaxID=37928 RepID=A0A1H0XLE7_9MICC|nr:hypothetical protein [Arthrobacter crystallopoietes]SDQ03748.1 hypothetical protein SAMN04489742_0164 [Arthrobacter crystallopoietes]
MTGFTSTIDYTTAQASGCQDPSRFQEVTITEIEHLWTVAYRKAFPAAELVTMRQGEVHFLFDMGSDEHSGQCARTVAAFGRVSGSVSIRDAVYQAGFPMKTVGYQAFDRGHMMPHSGGGQFGPNIYLQDRALNRGWSMQGRRYRALERKALKVPEGVLFCHLMYSDLTDVPTLVDLGFVSTTAIEVDTFINRTDLLIGAYFDPSKLSDAELTSILDVLTSSQFGDIGEETARFYLEDKGISPVSLGDSGMPRTASRQDLDIVALVEGELVAFEVKTTYIEKRAGTLTRLGNLHRPKLRRKAARSDLLPSHDQGSPDYVSQRVHSIVEVDGSMECRVIAVDLRGLKLQEFALNHRGEISGPYSGVVDCRDFVRQGMAEILQHRLHL